MLTATADDATRATGSANPAFTVTYTGFRNGETASVIDTPAVATSVADALSPIGTYAITVAGAVDNNYNFTYIDGLLTLTAPVAAPTGPVAGVGSSIPVTVEDALTGRTGNHIFVPRNNVFNPGVSRRNDIVVIAEDGLYNRSNAENDFLIAITDRVNRLDFGYSDDEELRQ
jgi:hypothetical protein